LSQTWHTQKYTGKQQLWAWNGQKQSSSTKIIQFHLRSTPRTNKSEIKLQKFFFSARFHSPLTFFRLDQDNFQMLQKSTDRICDTDTSISNCTGSYNQQMHWQLQSANALAVTISKCTGSYNQQLH